MKSSLKKTSEIVQLACHSGEKEQRTRKSFVQGRFQREKVGINLGQLVYFLGKRGKPDEDYTLLIDIIQEDVKDINHDDV